MKKATSKTENQNYDLARVHGEGWKAIWYDKTPPFYFVSRVFVLPTSDINRMVEQSKQEQFLQLEQLT